MHTLPTLIGDQGIHQINFRSSDIFRGHTRVTKKQITSVQLNISVFLDKHKNYSHWANVKIKYTLREETENRHSINAYNDFNSKLFHFEENDIKFECFWSTELPLLRKSARSNNRKKHIKLL